MPGAPISRWTMSYFAISILCLVTALVGMSVGFGFPIGNLAAPDTLVIVHLLAIGWLGLLFCGALLQFVPVLAAAKPRYEFVAAPALIMLVGGLLALLGGFSSLGGRLELDLLILPLGGVCLIFGFLMLSLSFAATILSQKTIDHSGRLVLIGLASLLVTAVLGISFASILSGLVGWENSADFLALGLPVHALSGIIGWMSVTAVGVSYRLFSMFMLAPEKGFRTRPLFMAALAGLAILWLSLIVAFVNSTGSTLLMSGAILVFMLALVLYLSDIRQMVRSRRRKTLELNTLAGIGALAYLVLAAGLMLAAWVFPGLPNASEASVYALAMGWLTGLGLAQLYKIVPFLTWLEAYGPVMGRSTVPRVQDLVKEARGRVWFILYHAGVLVGITSLAIDMEMLFRLAAAAELAAVVGLAVELRHARRLDYAPDEIRLPKGAACPHLFYAQPI